MATNIAAISASQIAGLGTLHVTHIAASDTNVALTVVAQSCGAGKRRRSGGRAERIAHDGLGHRGAFADPDRRSDQRPCSNRRQRARFDQCGGQVHRRANECAGRRSSKRASRPRYWMARLAPASGHRPGPSPPSSARGQPRPSPRKPKAEGDPNHTGLDLSVIPPRTKNFPEKSRRRFRRSRDEACFCPRTRWPFAHAESLSGDHCGRPPSTPPSGRLTLANARAEARNDLLCLDP